MSTKTVYVCDECHKIYPDTAPRVTFDNVVRVHALGVFMFQRDRLDFCSVSCLTDFFMQQLPKA